MTLANGAYNDAVRVRREMVAHLRLMGYTEREITLRLASGKKPLFNPQTGEPYSRQTVHNDLKLLRDKWVDNAAKSTNEHQTRQLAEIQAIKRQAFLDRDGMLALRAIDREIKILGTSAPEQIKIDVNINYELVTRVYQALQQADKNPEAVLTRLVEQVERVH